MGSIKVFFFGAKEPLEVIFSPKKGKKKKEEVIFKFKKFSSVLCHLRYSRRKRENEHVYIYIYIYGSQIFSSFMEDFPQFGDKREKIHYSATIYLSLFTYYYSSVTDEY